MRYIRIIGIFTLLVFVYCSGTKETMKKIDPGLADRAISIIDNYGPNPEPAPSLLDRRGIANLQQKMINTPMPEVATGEYAVIETTMGFIVFELLPEVAPNHCANFKKLSNSGFYDWITFHRVIPGYIVQTGSINTRNNIPLDDSLGNPGYTVSAEFSKLKHRRGTVSMARKEHVNSAGSQFFITLARASGLDNEYTIFGRVIQGMDVVEKIVDVERDDNDRPVKEVYVKRIRVVKP